jgi:hypothetical protein
MIRMIAMLDADGNLDLAALGQPYSPGEAIEYFIAGDSLVLCRRRDAVTSLTLAHSPAARPGPVPAAGVNASDFPSDPDVTTQSTAV